MPPQGTSLGQPGRRRGRRRGTVKCKQLEPFALDTWPSQGAVDLDPGPISRSSPSDDSRTALVVAAGRISGFRRGGQGDSQVQTTASKSFVYVAPLLGFFSIRDSWASIGAASCCTYRAPRISQHSGSPIWESAMLPRSGHRGVSSTVLLVECGALGHIETIGDSRPLTRVGCAVAYPTEATRLMLN
ncbi:hypothetical protein SCOR_31925 [Sulfidibacter corallicola]